MGKGLVKIHFKREYFIKLILEVFSVIFAVTLALFVNEWRQDNANKRLAKNAYINIMIEINKNKSKVDSALIHHNELLVKMDSVIGKLRNSPDHSIGDIDIGSINMEVLSNTAWSTIKSTQVINYMDFDFIMDISNLYSVQEIYTKGVDKFLNDKIITDMFSITDYYDDEETIKQELIKTFIAIKTHIVRMVNIGKQLSDAYKESLVDIKDSDIK